MVALQAVALSWLAFLIGKTFKEGATYLSRCAQQLASIAAAANLLQQFILRQQSPRDPYMVIDDLVPGPVVAEASYPGLPRRLRPRACCWCRAKPDLDCSEEASKHNGGATASLLRTCLTQCVQVKAAGPTRPHPSSPSAHGKLLRDASLPSNPSFLIQRTQLIRKQPESTSPPLFWRKLACQ